MLVLACMRARMGIVHMFCAHAPYHNSRISKFIRISVFQNYSNAGSGIGTIEFELRTNEWGSQVGHGTL